MGNCCSSETGRNKNKGKGKQPATISGPEDVTIQVPRNRANAQGVPIGITSHDMDAVAIENALDLASDFLRQRYVSLTIIAVGGVVNTLFLGSRQATHDVDFFGSHLSSADLRLLDEAMQHARRTSTFVLGGDWLNNETLLHLPGNVHARVTNAAFEQNEIMYDRPGLKVLAAPWQYAFCGKLDRLRLPDSRREFDVSDAVVYLHRYIAIHGGPVSRSNISRWCQNYAKRATNTVLDEINAAYRLKYGSRGIERRC